MLNIDAKRHWSFWAVAGVTVYGLVILTASLYRGLLADEPITVTKPSQGKPPSVVEADAESRTTRRQETDISKSNEHPLAASNSQASHSTGLLPSDSDAPPSISRQMPSSGRQSQSGPIDPTSDESPSQAKPELMQIPSLEVAAEGLDDEPSNADSNPSTVSPANDLVYQEMLKWFSSQPQSSNQLLTTDNLPPLAGVRRSDSSSPRQELSREASAALADLQTSAAANRYFRSLAIRLDTVGQLNLAAQKLTEEAKLVLNAGELKRAQRLLNRVTELREMAAELLLERL